MTRTPGSQTDPAPARRVPGTAWALPALGLGLGAVAALAATGVMPGGWAVGALTGIVAVSLFTVFAQVCHDAEFARQYDGLVRKLGPAGLLGLAWGVMPGVLGILLLANIGPVSGLLRQEPTLGLAGYVSVFVLAAGLGLLPTYAQAILGGWVFGFWIGLPAALAGFAGGAVVGYAVARTVSKHRVEDVIAERPKLRAVRDALIGRGFWRTAGVVALVRIPPNSPFAITNLVLASSGAKIAPYALGTLVGMTPRTAIAVGLAAWASTGDDIGAFIEQTRRNKYMVIGGLAAVIVVLGVLGKIANKALERVTVGAESGESPQPAD